MNITIKNRLFILFAVSLLLTGYNTKATAGTLKVGDTITNFSLPDGITGEKVTYKKDILNKSKLIVFAFVTTTCSACQSEMTLLSKLANENEDLKLYAICVDINGKSTVPLYNKNFGFKARYMLDPDFIIPQKFGFTFTPSLIVATGEGEILFTKGGYSEEAGEEVTEVIEDALK